MGKLRRLTGYQVVDYRTQRRWGRGDYICADLTPLGKMLWDLALPYQDRRHDTGHAEYVVRQALQLASLAGLSPAEREAVAAAAIDHDTGWSDIPDVARRFDRALARRGTGETGARMMRSLRDLHQKYGVKRADLFFDVLEAQFEAAGEAPEAFASARYCRECVKAIVACHDTRDYAEMPPLAPFVLDADRLAQLSIVEYESRFAHLTLEQVFERFDRNADRGNYLLPDLSAAIARLELVNTLVTIACEISSHGKPELLPAGVFSEYGEELKRLFPDLAGGVSVSRGHNLTFSI